MWSVLTGYFFSVCTCNIYKALLSEASHLITRLFTAVAKSQVRVPSGANCLHIEVVRLYVGGGGSGGGATFVKLTVGCFHRATLDEGRWLPVRCVVRASYTPSTSEQSTRPRGPAKNQQLPRSNLL